MNTHSSLPMPFSKAWGWAVFVTLLFLVNYMSRSSLSPVLVSLEQDLDVGHAQATSLLLVQGIGFALIQCFAGFIVGKVPPGRVAACSIMASGACLLCMLLVRDITQARWVFFCFGGCAGLYFPAGLATLGTLVYPRDWGKAVGIHELAPNLGFILIPLVAQGALLFTDWRGVFACIGAGTLLAGAAFLRWGRGGESPMAPPSFRGSAAILRDKATWAIAFLLAVTMSGEFSVFSVLQLFLVNEGGYTMQEANWLLCLSRLPSPLAVLLGGWAADRMRPLWVMGGCLALHAVALALMNLPGVFMLAGVCLQAVSIALCFPSLFKAISGCFPLEQQPLLLSFAMPVAALASTGFAPWFLGLCGQYMGFGVGFMALAGVSLVSLAVLPLLHARPGLR